MNVEQKSGYIGFGVNRLTANLLDIMAAAETWEDKGRALVELGELIEAAKNLEYMLTADLHNKFGNGVVKLAEDLSLTLGQAESASWKSDVVAARLAASIADDMSVIFDAATGEVNPPSVIAQRAAAAALSEAGTGKPSFAWSTKMVGQRLGIKLDDVRTMKSGRVSAKIKE